MSTILVHFFYFLQISAALILSVVLGGVRLLEFIHHNCGEFMRIHVVPGMNRLEVK